MKMAHPVRVKARRDPSRGRIPADPPLRPGIMHWRMSWPGKSTNGGVIHDWKHREVVAGPGAEGSRNGANEPNVGGPGAVESVWGRLIDPASARTNPMRRDGGQTIGTVCRTRRIEQVTTSGRPGRRSGRPPGPSTPNPRERTQFGRAGGCRDGWEKLPGPGKRANEPNSPRCERHRGHAIDTVGRIRRIRLLAASVRLNRGLRKTAGSVVRQAGPRRRAGQAGRAGRFSRRAPSGRAGRGGRGGPRGSRA